MLWLALPLALDAPPSPSVEGVVEVPTVDGAWTRREPVLRPRIEYVEGTEGKHDAWWFDLATGEGSYQPMRQPKGWIHWRAEEPDEWSWRQPPDRATPYHPQRTQARFELPQGSLVVQRGEVLIVRLDGKEPIRHRIPPSLSSYRGTPPISTLSINPARTEALIDGRMLLDLRTGHFELPVPELADMAGRGGLVDPGPPEPSSLAPLLALLVEPTPYAPPDASERVARRYGCVARPTWPDQLGQLSPECTTQLVDQRVESLLDGTLLRDLPQFLATSDSHEPLAPDLGPWQDEGEWTTWIFDDGTWVSIAEDGRAVGNEHTGALGWREGDRFVPVLPVTPLPAQPTPPPGLVRGAEAPASRWGLTALLLALLAAVGGLLWRARRSAR